MSSDSSYGVYNCVLRYVEMNKWSNFEIHSKRYIPLKQFTFCCFLFLLVYTVSLENNSSNNTSINPTFKQTKQMD